jgi:MCP family monocarboxylic acid transporter-like MFS transporter 10
MHHSSRWAILIYFTVFLAYYINDPRYSNQKNATYLLPIIGNLCTGLMYFSGLIVYPMMSRYPFTRRYLTWFGTLLCCVSLLGASYTRSVTVLVLLQGILYAVGGSILYAPCISYTSEWFVEKRGFANGVIFAGKS